MADLQTNHDLHLKRLKYKRSQLQLQLEGYEVRRAEIEDELHKLQQSELGVKNSVVKITKDIETIESRIKK